MVSRITDKIRLHETAIPHAYRQIGSVRPRLIKIITNKHYPGHRRQKRRLQPFITPNYFVNTESVDEILISYKRFY